MRPSLVILAAAVLSTPACTVPLPPLSFDAGSDTAPELDAPVDAAELDAATPIDAGEDDAGAPDAGAPDAGTDAPVAVDAPTDAGRSCDDIYGRLAEYQLCAETATPCEFLTRTSGTCAMRCGSRGGTCIEAFDEGAFGGECMRMGAASCTASLLQTICVCTR